MFILEEQSVFQDRLDQVGGLLGRLQNVQNQRLSAPLPTHLSQIPHPSPQEIQLGMYLLCLLLLLFSYH